MAYIPPTSHATLLATLRRERLLPAPGEVVAQPGERVEAGDLIARAIIADQHFILDLVKTLEVPKDKTGAFMVKRDGDAVKKGELIAVRKALMGIVVLPVPSPVDGLLLASGDGKALVAAVSKPFELRAGLPGHVVSKIEGRGVVIETTGALLEGVWGNGHEHFSVLRVLGHGPQDVLLAEQIELSLRGVILAVGVLQDDSAFKQLAEVAVSGLIVGSLKADLIPAVHQWRIPVMVTDGFGTQGFSTPAYNLLVGNTGREVWLNAQAWDRFGGARPEAIIPLPSPGQAPAAPPDGQPLEVGRRIRVVRGAPTGQTGTVVALSDKAIAFPSGVRGRAATVKVDDAEALAAIPLANLEILE